MKSKESLFEDLQCNSPEGEWKGMPEFVQEDQRPFQKIIVNFKTKEDVDAFSKLIGHKLSYRADTIWFPFRPNQPRDKVYEDYPEAT
jgi:hypothetical protein